jgi:hypothetical protein
MTGPETTTETTAGRRRLPNRRAHELLSFEHGGIHYIAGVGRFENGDLAEIFLNTGRHGTTIDTNARDAAVAASLLLQYGCIAVKNGRTYALELNRPGGRLSQAQSAAHAVLRDAGAVVATTFCLDDAIVVLEDWGLPRGRASVISNRVREQR